MDPRIDQIMRELRERLSQHYGDELAGLELFGSCARGAAASESDIDVLVLLNRPVDPYDEAARISPITAEMSLRHDTVISCIAASKSEYDAASTRFLQSVQREGVGY